MPKYNIDVYVDDYFLYTVQEFADDAEEAERYVRNRIEIQFDTTEIE